MAQQDVVDELIVTLTLDAERYQTVEAKVERESDRTYRKQQDRARGTDKTNRDQQKRLSDVAAGVRSFAKQVTAAVGVVTGLGAAVVGTLGGFLGFETALRRQTIGTALSNKQMQAWGATARRLGADADAGAEAIAGLAKERQQYELTGNAPTLQAFARMGVNVDKGRPLEDVLAQAQQIYRGAPEGQKQQIENTLAAQNVSPDLILMIKSETDVREAFTKSLSQATEENRQALDRLADAFESIKSTSISVAGTLLEALEPAIKEGAAKLGEFATQLQTFTKDVQDAGGGVEGFQTALDKNAPELGRTFRDVTDTVSVVRDQFHLFWQSLKDLGSWVMYFLNKVRYPFSNEKWGDAIVAGAKAAFGDAGNWWQQRVQEAKRRNAIRDAKANGTATAGNPEGLPRNIEEGAPQASNPYGLPRNIEEGAPAAGARPSGKRLTAQTLMQTLTSQYGLTVPQAAAVTANWQHESSLRPDSINNEGGGTGARGLAQWRGPRTAAFVKRFGVTPDKASWEQQVEFAMTDPEERRRLRLSFAPGGTAAQLGVAVSRKYEAHGDMQQDIERGKTAEKLAAQYSQSNTTNTSSAVTIGTVNVQTNDPREFVAGLQRIPATQDYNTVIR